MQCFCGGGGGGGGGRLASLACGATSWIFELWEEGQGVEGWRGAWELTLVMVDSYTCPPLFSS